MPEYEPAEILHCFVKRYKTEAKVRVDFEPGQFKDKYIDEYDVLDQSLIKAAIVEELTYFSEKEVWMLEDLDKMKNIAEHVFVRSRWVLCNKGDIDEPDMRARLVACEVNKGQKDWNFYASTPPLESKKFLFSEYATEQRRMDSNGKWQPLR